MKPDNNTLTPIYMNLLQKRRRVDVAKEVLDHKALDPTSNTTLLVTTRRFMDMTTVQKSSEWRHKKGTEGHSSRG